MDGIIKETLSNTACSSKVPSEVIQETEEKEISDNQKSDEKIVLICSNMSSVITDKTNLVF